MRTVACFTIANLLFLGSIACTAPEPAPDPQPAVEAESPPVASPEATTPDAELEQIRTRLEAVKTQLFDEGEYNCCVQPSCSWCALHEGSCACFTNLQAGEAVCPGCGLGWHNGEGIVDGVDPDAVEWNITHEHPSGGHAH